MLQTIALASLIATSLVVVPSPRAISAEAARITNRQVAALGPVAIRMQEADAAEPAPAAPLEDFTEDLLDALAMDESPMSEMEGEPVFVKDESADALEPLLAFTNSMTIKAAKEKYKLHENDCGSAQVQVAVLTARIQYMTKHMQENKKDYSSLRGLNAMVVRRRKLLEYLLREDLPEFKRITSELGIRTNQLLKPKLAGARGRRE